MIGTLGLESFHGTSETSRHAGKVLMTHGVLTRLKRPIWVNYEPDDENDWIVNAFDGRFVLDGETLPQALLSLQEAMECTYLHLKQVGPARRTHDADEWLEELETYFGPLGDNGDQA